MSEVTTRVTTHSDVLIVGAGPAGLAAASAAAARGRTVTVLDDNSGPGGQIWRNAIPPLRGKGDPAKAAVISEFEQSGAVLLAGRRVVDAPRPGVLRTIRESAEGAIEDFSWERLILATGARERFLPFPGWTLPGVFGAGGLQALVKNGFPVRGKRVVVAGTGPLLLAVAAYLQKNGATVVAVAEQASMRQLLPFAVGLCAQPSKLWQGMKYRAALLRAPYRTGCWPVSAEAVEAVGALSAVRLTDGQRTWTERCDLLACGFHLVPNTELAVLLGCRLEGEHVLVDAGQQTSVPGIFCAGEPTGIAGLDAAALQGRVAGFAAAGAFVEAAALHAKRDSEGGFGQRLQRAFTLRPEVLRLASADTIVCRCEDVRYGELQAQRCWTEAKLQTRCGMGPCQGRVCGPAVHALFGWQNTSIRPPLSPVPLSTFFPEPTPLKTELQNHRRHYELDRRVARNYYPLR